MTYSFYKPTKTRIIENANGGICLLLTGKAYRVTYFENDTLEDLIYSHFISNDVIMFVTEDNKSRVVYLADIKHIHSIASI